MIIKFCLDQRNSLWTVCEQYTYHTDNSILRALKTINYTCSSIGYLEKDLLWWQTRHSSCHYCRQYKL